MNAEEQVLDLREELRVAQQWVDDLQSGMYINCVYCGHRYGPKDEVTASMADVLKSHVEQWPQHPMSKAKILLGLALKSFWYTASRDADPADVQKIALRRVGDIVSAFPDLESELPG